MDDLKSKVLTVVDQGLFTDMALAVAPGFKSTNYWTPWQSSFPLSNSLLPGDGFDEMERIKWLDDVFDETDLYMFPDVNFGDKQVFLEKLGKRVWGARKGESLELQRVATKKLLAKLGLPVGPYEVCSGIGELRECLKKKNNVWIKTSLTRGDMETWHSDRYELSKVFLDSLEYRLGETGRKMEFVVEDSIDGDNVVETGYDGYCIDGQFPDKGFFGFEIKDKGYAIKAVDYSEIPEVVTHINKMLAPWMKEKNYRGFFSSEIRVKDGEGYLIDPCARLGSPPNEIYQEMVENWPEIIWEGAAGNLVTPKMKYKYGFEVLMHCPAANDDWVPIYFPDKIRQFVKIRNHYKSRGLDFFVPQPPSKLPEIGAVIGFGDTLEEAIAHVKENAEQVQAYGLDIKLESIDECCATIEQAKEIGVEF